jgi:class 3 adenylate cyclase
LLRDYHAAIGKIIIKYSGTLERYAGDGVMVVFNDPVPVENPALQAVLMALEMRDAISFPRQLLAASRRPNETDHFVCRCRRRNSDLVVEKR